jgi:hypothetical protein
MDSLEFHPLANIFPMMTAEETNALGEDMLKHAQREPIWLYEGKILDGRNRYNACILKEIEPRFTEFRGPDPLAFVVSANLHRRQLNAGQRALVVETLANLPHGGDRRSDQAATIAACDKATVAKLGKVSPRTISTAKALKRDAIPAVVDAVQRGEVPIAQAAAFANQTPPLDQARLVAEHGTPANAVKATVKGKADRAIGPKPKPVPDVSPAADRAEQAAGAKQAASAPARFIDAIENLEHIDVSAAILRMSDDDRIALMTQIARANARLNKAAIEIAISGGANIGVLAPVERRFKALDFLRKAVARIEAELGAVGEIAE